MNAILAFCRWIKQHRHCRTPLPRSLVKRISTKAPRSAGGHRPRALFCGVIIALLFLVNVYLLGNCDGKTTMAEALHWVVAV